jgi:hypothetical protein
MNTMTAALSVEKFSTGRAYPLPARGDTRPGAGEGRSLWDPTISHSSSGCAARTEAVAEVVCK